MPTKKKLKEKKATKWTKYPFLSVVIDDGQACIMNDYSEVKDHLDLHSYIEHMENPGEKIVIEISVVMMTEKQRYSLPEREG